MRPLEEVSVDALVALRRRAPVAVGILTAHPASAVPALLLLGAVARAALQLPESPSLLRPIITITTSRVD